MNLNEIPNKFYIDPDGDLLTRREVRSIYVRPQRTWYGRRYYNVVTSYMSIASDTVLLRWSLKEAQAARKELIQTLILDPLKGAETP